MKFGVDKELMIGDKIYDGYHEKLRGALGVESIGGCEWITKQDAIAIIGHLKRVFEIGTGKKGIGCCAEHGGCGFKRDCIACAEECAALIVMPRLR